MDPRNSTASPVSGDELAGRSVEPGVPAGRVKRGRRGEIGVAGVIRNGSRKAADQCGAGATRRAVAASGFCVTMEAWRIGMSVVQSGAVICVVRHLTMVVRSGRFGVGVMIRW